MAMRRKRANQNRRRRPTTLRPIRRLAAANERVFSNHPLRLRLRLQLLQHQPNKRNDNHADLNNKRPNHHDNNNNSNKRSRAARQPHPRYFFKPNVARRLLNRRPTRSPKSRQLPPQPHQLLDRTKRAATTTTTSAIQI